jgi:hypothetical protein
MTPTSPHSSYSLGREADLVSNNYTSPPIRPRDQQIAKRIPCNLVRALHMITSRSHGIWEYDSYHERRGDLPCDITQAIDDITYFRSIKQIVLLCELDLAVGVEYEGHELVKDSRILLDRPGILSECYSQQLNPDLSIRNYGNYRLRLARSYGKE